MARIKLSIERDEEMERLSKLRLDACTAYLIDSSSITVMGELVSTAPTPQETYKEIQIIVFDKDGDIASREYTNWTSFGLRQSFQIDIELIEFHSENYTVKAYPSNG